MYLSNSACRRKGVNAHAFAKIAPPLALTTNPSSRLLLLAGVLRFRTSVENLFAHLPAWILKPTSGQIKNHTRILLRLYACKTSKISARTQFASRFLDNLGQRGFVHVPLRAPREIVRNSKLFLGFVFVFCLGAVTDGRNGNRLCILFGRGRKRSLFSDNTTGNV